MPRYGLHVTASPRLTERTKIVVRELFKLICEHVDGFYGNLIRTQRGKIEKMIDGMNDEAAAMIATHITDVADFLNEPEAKPAKRVAGARR